MMVFTTLPHLALENRSDPLLTDILVHNVQGLCSKLQDIEATYLNYAWIMCLTETWLNSTHKDSDITFDSFKVFRTDRRSANCRGGVAIYVKNDVSCVAIDLPGNDHNIEILMLRITLRMRNLLLVAIYRPTSVSVKVSKNTICECLRIIDQHDDVDTVIVTGDLNENLSNDETHHLYNLLLSRGYLQLVKQSTYLTGSLLDVVYVKGEGELLRADVAPIYFSDHEMVSVNIPP